MERVRQICRRAAVAAGLAAGPILAHPVAQQVPGYVERVEVARVVVDVRVIGGDKQPVPDLGAEHFRVKIDGRPARVESVRWESGQVDEELLPMPDPEATFGQPVAGRLIVFFVQKNFEPSRLTGLMRILPKADEFITRLERSDRVAVVSFDTHLSLWLDFTRDRERLRRLLDHDLLMGGRPVFNISPAPSLFASLEPSRAKRIASPEEALEAVAEALAPLPGAKSLVLLAYGFGRLSRTGVQMEAAYDRARDALLAARVTVFAIDVTQADAHSLQVGLETVAEDTGGFYASTFLFPDRALMHLERALAGHYVLVVENPRQRRGRHRIDVDLVGRRGTVFARRTFVD